MGTEMKNLMCVLMWRNMITSDKLKVKEDL